MVEETGRVRSLNNDTPTFVTFVNRSQRNIDLFWLDYTGNLVRYGHMAPNMGLHMDTYVTHPWVAMDTVTGYPLKLNGDNIFLPQSERGNRVFHDEDREIVSICIPVYSLYRRCLEAVHMTIPKGIWDQENLPTKVKEHLNCIRRPEQFIDYDFFSQTVYANMENGNNVDNEDADDNGDESNEED